MSCLHDILLVEFLTVLKIHENKCQIQANLNHNISSKKPSLKNENSIQCNEFMFWKNKQLNLDEQDRFCRNLHDLLNSRDGACNRKNKRKSIMICGVSHQAKIYFVIIPKQMDAKLYIHVLELQLFAFKVAVKFSIQLLTR